MYPSIYLCLFIYATPAAALRANGRGEGNPTKVRFVYLPNYLSLFICVCYYNCVYLYLYISLSIYLCHPRRRAYGRREPNEGAIYIGSLSLSLCIFIELFISIHLSMYPSIYLSIYLCHPRRFTCQRTRRARPSMVCLSIYLSISILM